MFDVLDVNIVRFGYNHNNVFVNWTRRFGAFWQVTGQQFEYVRVDVSNSMIHSNDVQEPLPRQIKIRLRWNGNVEVMELFKNPKITTNTPVFILKDDAVLRQKLPSNNNDGIYENKMHGASFHLSFEQRWGTFVYTVFGNFLWKFGEELLVEPVGSYFEGQTFNHYISKNIINIDIGGYIPTGTLQPIVKRKFDSTRSPENTDYVIELAFVVDYSIYRLWYERSGGRSEKEKDINVKQALRKYYGVAFSEIDMRLQNIAEMDFSLSASLVGLYIADSASASPWIFPETISSDLLPTQRDAQETLKKLRRWVSSKPTFPGHDHVIGFTALDLLRKEIFDQPVITAGISTLASMCTVYSQSLLSDSFNLAVPRIAVHQIAHSFGADHDGDSGQCNQKTEGFVMDKNMKLTTWSFSPCSLKVFILQIYLLNSQGCNCLAETGTSFYPSETSWLSKEHPVPRIKRQLDTRHSNDSDRFTRAFNGLTHSNGACRTGISDEESHICHDYYGHGLYPKICVLLMCYVPSADHGSRGEDQLICRFVVSIDQIVCGKRKWCIKGKCEDAGSDIGFSDDCPLGDQPGIVHKAFDVESMSIKDITCEELIVLEPFMCYFPYILRRCCKSCASIKRVNQTGCDYGDVGFCTVDMCYLMAPITANWRCCETCESYKVATAPENSATTEAGCRGDLNGKVFGIKDKNLLWTCKAGLAYSTSLCYGSENYEACCATCNNYAKFIAPQIRGVSDCRYGDKDMLCWKNNCFDYNYEMKLKCCFACQSTEFFEKYSQLTESCSGDITTTVSDLGGQLCSWITGSRSHFCYIKGVLTACCMTCLKMYINQTDCEFGDRSFHCNQKMCALDFQQHRNLCCRTCYSYTLPNAVATKTSPGSASFWPHSTILIMVDSAQGFYVKCLKDIVVTICVAMFICLAAVSNTK